MNQAHHLSGSPDPQEQELDTEIASIRAEIQTLQRRKRILSSSLLSAPAIQTLLRNPPPSTTAPITSLEDLSPLARAADKHSTTNHYRIGFGTTAFPFLDPSPTASALSKNLLGVRIDVGTNNGRFAKPYYILLRRERARGKSSQKRFKVHRHTVPAFIALSKLERVYLPTGLERKAQSDEAEGVSDDDDDEESSQVVKGQGTRRQDLRGFVRELRRELVSWHLRCDAVDFLRGKLGLHNEDDTPGSSEMEHGTGIVSLAPTAIEARYVRLDWTDGRVGRFKLSNTGLVERAVVIGDSGRDQQTEEAMTGAGGRVETLLERLRKRAGQVL